MSVTLIVRRIAAYACPQHAISFELQLTHEFSLIVLIFFHHMQGNVTVSVSYTPILDSRQRSRGL